MGLSIVQVDAFTDTPFAGNPAAVCVLPEPRDPAWMQNVAREMNLSETAFLERRPDGFGLRWFTPALEVNLCGHATLASAHVLWQDGHLAQGETARFHTRSGILEASQMDGWIELDFPNLPAEPVEPIPGLAEALGAVPRFVGRNRHYHLAELDDEATVRSLKPSFAALAALPIFGLMVTSQAQTAGLDFISRFFAPNAGIDDDPVTGSAHCALAPYWAERLGKSELTGFQASARGGLVRVRMAGERVKIGGKAVTVLRGELLADR